MELPPRVLPVRFQSTPPARGATQTGGDIHTHTYISIHAPREGGDTYMDIAASALVSFQSTPPARGATTERRILDEMYKFQSTPPARGAT